MKRIKCFGKRVKRNQPESDEDFGVKIITDMDFEDKPEDLTKEVPKKLSPLVQDKSARFRNNRFFPLMVEMDLVESPNLKESKKSKNNSYEKIKRKTNQKARSKSKKRAKKNCQIKEKAKTIGKDEFLELDDDTQVPLTIKKCVNEKPEAIISRQVEIKEVQELIRSSEENLKLYFSNEIKGLHEEIHQLKGQLQMEKSMREIVENELKEITQIINQDLSKLNDTSDEASSNSEVESQEELEVTGQNRNQIVKTKTDMPKNVTNSPYRFGNLGMFEESKILTKDNIRFILTLLPQIMACRFLYSFNNKQGQNKVFHDLCDNSQHTLVIGKFNDRVSGGYNNLDWTGVRKYKQSDKSFLFSLDKKKVYRSTRPRYAIYGDPKAGPTFGGCKVISL